jgi:hypothetical protein
MFGGTWAFASSIVVLAQMQSTSNHRIIRDFSARSRGLLMIIMQQPAQPFATLHRPASSRLRVTRKQQGVVFPLMITLRTDGRRKRQGAEKRDPVLGRGRSLLAYRRISLVTRQRGESGCVAGWQPYPSTARAYDCRSKFPRIIAMAAHPPTIRPDDTAQKVRKAHSRLFRASLSPAAASPFDSGLPWSDDRLPCGARRRTST